MTSRFLAVAAERASALATAAHDLRGDSWDIHYATDRWALIFQWRHRQTMRLWGCWSDKSNIPVGSPLPYNPVCCRRAGRSGNPSRPSNLIRRAGSEKMVQLARFMSLEKDTAKHAELLREIAKRCPDAGAAKRLREEAEPGGAIYGLHSPFPRRRHPSGG